MSRETVRRGRWLYDGAAYMPVAVVRLDSDFWYEIGRADGDLEPDEVPHVNAEGAQYYVCFRSDPDADPGWVDSPGFDTLEEACAWAATRVPSAIEWLTTEPRVHDAER